MKEGVWVYHSIPYIHEHGQVSVQNFIEDLIYATLSRSYGGDLFQSAITCKIHSLIFKTNIYPYISIFGQERRGNKEDHGKPSRIYMENSFQHHQFTFINSQSIKYLWNQCNQMTSHRIKGHHVGFLHLVYFSCLCWL